MYFTKHKPDLLQGTTVSDFLNELNCNNYLAFLAEVSSIHLATFQNLKQTPKKVPSDRVTIEAQLKYKEAQLKYKRKAKSVKKIFGAEFFF